jgi:serine protease Do
MSASCRHAAEASIVNRSSVLARIIRPILLLLLLSACSSGGHAQRNEAAQEAAQEAPEVGSEPIGGLPDFRPLVRKYGDAVVNVEVMQRRQQAAGAPPIDPNDPLFDFFRRFGIPPPQFGPPGGQPPMRGAASGFIVSSDGYILTNAHVVAEADQVNVRLTDRREYSAKVVGVDPRTDVAVLKIDAQDLPVVKIGDPEQLEPGQWVLAIGSPFGLENSATAGIVSATARAVGGEMYVPFIQTDVAVNPGNSGGPLFNLRGEVVGINSMIFSRTGGYMGLSFAIPIDVAIDVRDQLIKTGRVVRGRIGVAVQDVNAQLAESFGLDRPGGALVSSVEEGAPAAKAGLRPGDVILAVNDSVIERYTELSSVIARASPGEELELGVWRDGKERTVKVQVEEMREPAARVAAAGQPSEPGGRLGLAVRPLSPAEKQQLDTEGSLVVERSGGPAAESGVLPGDVILGVNGRPIKSVQQLQKAVEDGPESVALLIERGGAQLFVPVQTRNGREADSG